MPPNNPNEPSPLLVYVTVEYKRDKTQGEKITLPQSRLSGIDRADIIHINKNLL